MWCIVGLGLWRGVKYIGQIAYITATVPYAIIGISNPISQPNFQLVLQLHCLCVV